MNFPNERYVRLYSRDTTTWLKWKWEGRATFALLLRKLDRSGRLQLDGEGVVDAIMLHTGLPVEVAAAGWAQISTPGKDGTATVVIKDGAIVMPNYRAAQEAKASDALRAQEYRDRKRVTEGDDASRSVTDESRTVTTRHDSSQAVTPSLAEPSRARKKSLAVSPPGDPPEQGDEAETPDLAAPSRQAYLDAIATASSGRFVASKPAKGGAFKLDAARKRPGALDEASRIGRWLAADGDWRAAKGQKLDGRNIGPDLEAWIAQSDQWARTGGGVATRAIPNGHPPTQTRFAPPAATVVRSAAETEADPGYRERVAAIRAQSKGTA